MPAEVWAAIGALLVAALNERRASIRARQADADRREALARAAAEHGNIRSSADDVADV
jgi:hypothetical protein